MTDIINNIDNESEDDTLNNTNINLDKNVDKKKKKKKTAAKDKVKDKDIVKPLNPMAKLALQRMKLVEAENERIRLLQEEEAIKIKEEEEKEKQKLLKEQQDKDKKKKAKQDKIQLQKQQGIYKTKSEKEKEKKNLARLENLKKMCVAISDSILLNNSIIFNQDINNENDEDTNYIDSDLRAPIFCIMGHVDTGKTTLLDNIRNTNVQEGEAGGITQQIGGTFISYDKLLSKSNLLNKDIKIPGLIMIDTPGHEAFANLRYRGSSLCDIAIVIIDIVHGLEPQTIESINILKESNIKFIFALNKIDRLYGWEKNNSNSSNISIQDLINQNVNSINEFRNRLNDIIGQIMSIGINSALYWENDSKDDTVSICPISAKSGEGISDLLSLIIDICQTDYYDQIKYTNELKCIIMEKSIMEGVGATLDLLLINGELNKGDEITIQTSDGFIKTHIKDLLTPPPNRESRVKSEYIHHSILKGAIGLKLVANNLDKAIVGSQINYQDHLGSQHNLLNGEKQLLNRGDDLIDQPTQLNLVHPDVISATTKSFELQDIGVTVYASTDGALEALMHFLQKECNPSIPVSEVYIGNILKKHITKLALANNSNKNKEFSSILAFNVTVDEEVQALANKSSIKIFNAEIIYHLFDQFIKYKDEVIKERKDSLRHKAVFPCILKILPKNIYNKKSPLIFGVSILKGKLHIGTPLIIPELNLTIGKVVSIQHNGKDIAIGQPSTDVCIKVENTDNPNITYDRHFNHTNQLYSSISRESIDILKEHFKDEMVTDDVKLLIEIKKILKIT